MPIPLITVIDTRVGNETLGRCQELRWHYTQDFRKWYTQARMSQPADEIKAAVMEQVDMAMDAVQRRYDNPSGRGIRNK